MHDLETVSLSVHAPAVLQASDFKIETRADLDGLAFGLECSDFPAMHYLETVSSSVRAPAVSQVADCDVEARYPDDWLPTSCTPRARERCPRGPDLLGELDTPEKQMPAGPSEDDGDVPCDDSLQEHKIARILSFAMGLCESPGVDPTTARSLRDEIARARDYVPV